MATTKKPTEESDQGVAKLDSIINKAKIAQRKYATFNQVQVDKIFKAAAMAANDQRIALAIMAEKETGMGVAEDKVIKNHFASEFIYNAYKDLKTCGEIESDPSSGIIKVAEPVGIIAGIIPTTNPTSTTIFKALCALKTRNAIVFSPHPRSKNCTIETVRVIMDAAIKAGAPADLVGCIETPSVALSQHLMGHADINLILATGGPGMVKAAYSSGKPALGVGPGNTPVIIDETADVDMAVSSILMSKTFDNGMICASEQSVSAHVDVYEQVKQEFTRRGAYILSAAECKTLGQTIIKDCHLNAEIVGQSAYKIAKMAGIKVAKETKVLIGEVSEISDKEPFAFEKLSPCLALYKVDTFEQGLANAVKLLNFAGIGHTSVLYTNSTNDVRISEFGQQMQTARTLINMPAAHGAIGDLYNFKLAPSLTLGCGSWGGNSISQNVGPTHLINIKTVAARRENMLWFQVPPKTYFKSGSLNVALTDLKDRKRAFLVTDRFLFENGYAQPIIDRLESLGIKVEVYMDVLPDPTLAVVRDGAKKMQSFKPDTIISLGGGSPMDAAKIMWLLYEHPDVKFEDLAMRFMDIRKRVFEFPKLGEKAIMVAIPTTSGTGSEVTPFAVITDEETGHKYPLADYELTPNIAIVDADLVMNMPKSLTAFGGIDALTHALEARVSIVATEYTNALAMESIRLIFKYLPRCYQDGPNDRQAREKMHNASTIAGMAFANAFLGVCHSMAHKIGAKFHIAHGLANAIMIPYVIKFNATDKPTKQGAFAQYKSPEAISRYAMVADMLQLGGKTEAEKVEKLIEAIEALKKELNIPNSIKACGVTKKEFMAAIDELSEQAFDDQCTGANPRYPLISEIKAMYLDAFEGNL